jgi:hypothetical protein
MQSCNAGCGDAELVFIAVRTCNHRRSTSVVGACWCPRRFIDSGRGLARHGLLQDCIRGRRSRFSVSPRDRAARSPLIAAGSAASCSSTPSVPRTEMRQCRQSPPPRTPPRQRDIGRHFAPISPRRGYPSDEALDPGRLARSFGKFSSRRDRPGWSHARLAEQPQQESPSGLRVVHLPLVRIVDSRLCLCPPDRASAIP